MKIGILTITPNVGFGGIMQAFALKNVLDNMGHETQIIQYVHSDSLKNRILYIIHSLTQLIFHHNYIKFSSKSELKFRSQNLLPFIDKYLNFSVKVDNASQLNNLINTTFDAVVVGSDQVWRPKYVLGIENYFLKGVKQNIIKLSYAASFGVDNWEFTESETLECSNLLRNFVYVSVREQSGIKLIYEHLRYDGNVYCDLDPTFLLQKDTYVKLASPDDSCMPNIFTYILDPNQDKKSLVDCVISQTFMELRAFNTNAENPNKPLRERVAPKVEDWLTGIINSTYVITDSYHGCVFSIIFNKPFIVYVNKDRGSERFMSLLSMLGLQKRMIYDMREYKNQLLEAKIDWDKVNVILEEKRNVILRRLSDMLSTWN